MALSTVVGFYRGVLVSAAVTIARGKQFSAASCREIQVAGRCQRRFSTK